MNVPPFIEYMCGMVPYSSTSHHGKDRDTEDEDEWSLFDFASNPPLCCKDSTMDAIFRFTHFGDETLPQVSRGTSLLKNDDEDGDELDPEEEQKIATPTAWSPPIYRNMSLHSAPSRAEEYSNHHHQGPTIIPNDASTAAMSPPRSYEFDDEPLPIDFAPPRHKFSRSFDHLDRDVHSELTMSPTITSLPSDHPSSSPVTSSGGVRHHHQVSAKARNFKADMDTTVDLRPTDVICGRGAPTSIHPGNMAFKKIIQRHEMSYLCARRSDKPKIALSLLDEFRAQGVRFVKRERDEHTTGSSDSDDAFVWVEIGDRRAYEKICQALREGAPQLRRQMLAHSTQALRATATLTTTTSPRTEKDSKDLTPKAIKTKKDRGEARDERSAAVVGRRGSRAPPVAQRNELLSVPGTTTTTRHPVHYQYHYTHIAKGAGGYAATHGADYWSVQRGIAEEETVY